jgi:hypothetical protein
MGTAPTSAKIRVACDENHPSRAQHGRRGSRDRAARRLDHRRAHGHRHRRRCHRHLRAAWRARGRVVLASRDQRFAERHGDSSPQHRVRPHPPPPHRLEKPDICTLGLQPRAPHGHGPAPSPRRPDHAPEPQIRHSGPQRSCIEGWRRPSYGVQRSTVRPMRAQLDSRPVAQKPSPISTASRRPPGVRLSGSVSGLATTGDNATT